MKPLDDCLKWLPIMKECAHTYLSESEYEQFQTLSSEEIAIQLVNLLEKPIMSFTVVNDVYFRARWAEVLKLLHPGQDLSLLEVATGDADMIPQVMDRTHPNGRYITANMNKNLNASLLRKTENLGLNLQLIEDDAAHIVDHLGHNAVDIIAFQHAINDVIQAILCDQAGIDTTFSDWMEALPRMIEILQQEIKQNTLELHAKQPFLQLIDTLLQVLKPNGIIAMNHYMFQLDLDWGYPPALFEHMVPMIRNWLLEMTDCEEITVDGFDPQWWIFLQKKSS